MAAATPSNLVHQQADSQLQKRLRGFANQGFETITHIIPEMNKINVDELQVIFEKKHATISNASNQDLTYMMRLVLFMEMTVPDAADTITLKIEEPEGVGALISAAVGLKTTVTGILYGNPTIAMKTPPSKDEMLELINKYKMAPDGLKRTLISIKGRKDKDGGEIVEFNNWKTKAIHEAGLVLPHGVIYAQTDNSKYLTNSQQCPLLLLASYLAHKYGPKTLVPTLFLLTATNARDKATYKQFAIDEVKWCVTNANPLLIPGSCLTKGRLEYAIYLALGKGKIVSAHGLSLANGSARVTKILRSMVDDCIATLRTKMDDKQVASIGLSICNIVQRYFQPRNTAVMNHNRIKFDNYIINGQAVWTFNVHTKTFERTPIGTVEAAVGGFPPPPTDSSASVVTETSTITSPSSKPFVDETPLAQSAAKAMTSESIINNPVVYNTEVAGEATEEGTWDHESTDVFKV